VVHGHVKVNTKRADAPGMLVRPGDTIRVSENEKSKALIKNEIAMSRGIRQVPSWLNATDDDLKGDVVSLPKRADVPFDINELFVVEVCSR
ncbi:MAG: S4 domain-containing protein, partial [Gaiellaceae bacterium]